MSPTHVRCIVCGQQSYDGVREMFWISESERAKDFLAADFYFQGDIYTRVEDLESGIWCRHTVPQNMFGRMFKVAWIWNTESQDWTSIWAKDAAFERGNETFGPKLKEGYGFILLEICGLMNKLNKLAKTYLETMKFNFSYKNIMEKTCVSSSDSKNKSLMVLSENLGMDTIVQCIQKVDNIRSAAKDIRGFTGS